VKLLLDENLSDRVVGWLRDIYPDSAHVKQYGLTRSSDEAIWTYAKENGFVLVSKDWDFHQRSLMHGAPPKLILLRVGNCPTAISFAFCVLISR
jgi:predicted nuclease of predicted toxin-antitoxin system